MTTINLNQPPYFDDRVDGQKFYRILFRPGRAVQARELNQLQSILQNQLERFGKYVFDNGSVVYPMRTEQPLIYSNNVDFIKLASNAPFTNTEAELNQYWLNKILIKKTGTGIGLKAQVVGVRAKDASNQARLYLTYLRSDNTGMISAFPANEEISTDETASFSAMVADGAGAVGKVSSAKINQSIYFYNGKFVLVDEQTIFITPPAESINVPTAWNNSPTASIGLEFIESIVTSEDDVSLLENATLSTNSGAPGADRLRVAANLIQLPYNSSIADFVELLRVDGGTVQKFVTKTELSDPGLEKLLATRTFEESGDYSVIPFKVQVKEYLRTSEVNGAYSEEIYKYDTEAQAQAASVSIFGASSPVAFSITSGGTTRYMPGTSYNNPTEAESFVNLCKKFLVLSVDPGLAYVKGYRIEKNGVNNITIPKSRTTRFVNDNIIKTPIGNYVLVKDLYGQGITDSSGEFRRVGLYNNIIPTTNQSTSNGTLIGYARVLGIEYDDGEAQSNSDLRVYKMFLFDVEMIGNNKFEDVKSMYASGPTFSCNINLTRYPLTGSVYKATRSFVLAGSTSGSSTTLTVSSTQNVKPGMFITATGAGITIPTNTYVVSLTSATQLTLSAACTIPSSTQITFTSIANTDIGKNNAFIIGAGTVWRNNSTEALKAGDFIEINSGQTTSKIYKVKTNPSSDNYIEIDGTTENDSWPDGSTINYLYAFLNSDSEQAGLVYKLPNDAVAAVRGGTATIDYNNVDTSYYIRKVISNQSALGTTGNYYVNISLDPLGTEEFADYNITSYSVIGSDGKWLRTAKFETTTNTSGVAYVASKFNNSPKTLRIYVPSSGTYTILYTTYKRTIDSAKPKERKKTLVPGTFNPTTGAYVGDGFAVSGADNKIITLKHADVLRITRILESPNITTNPGNTQTISGGDKDVTGLYILDDGQRDYYYDIAKVTLRPGVAQPNGRIRVEYDYFTSDEGDYFSVDSYPFFGNLALDNPNSANMEYKDIPIFTASDGTNYDLASCIDFRPVRNPLTVDGKLPIKNIPKTEFKCDYHHYLSRKDKLCLDKFGEFILKTGIPNENPIFPDDLDSAMVLYEITVGAYTFSPNDISALMRDNKRYTMRDIGKLDQRISNLEYYTTLSLLEKDTNSLTITDANGNNRFKNGFLVDNFKSEDSADLGTPNFKASFDKATALLRPIINEDPDPPKLIERASLLTDADTKRSLKKYKKYGDIFTLRVESQPTFISQPLASKFVNINPYSKFVYVGSVTITPWTDEWRETAIAEPLAIRDESAYQAARSNFGPRGTRVDYTSTVTNWTSSTTTDPKVFGERIMEVAGHNIRDKFYPNISMSKWLSMKSVKVPDGYANAGQLVPTGRVNWVRRQTRSKTTETGEKITTKFMSVLEDQGFSQPISMGSRIIDTALIEYIRSREITFVGEAFKPGVRVYPFFDGVDVSAYCKQTGKNLGQPMICDGTGKISGTFIIPDPKTNTIKFRTGDRIFRLTTSSINSLDPAPDSAGDASYTARGWIDTKQETTFSTRLFNVASKTTNKTDPVSRITTNLGQTDAFPQDPLAQVFLIRDKGGCFITSVDVYFATKPDDNNPERVPVTLQLRTVGDEGGPTNKILPFGEVIKDSLEVVTNTIGSGNIIVRGNSSSLDPLVKGPWLNGEASPTGNISSGVPFPHGADPKSLMVPTRFTFSSPIYVAEGQYYAIVLIANTTAYNVWIAESGPDSSVVDPTKAPNNVEVGTNIPIDKPVFLDGGLFYSENGINWVLYPKQDLKFGVKKAQFNIQENAEIDFVNPTLPFANLISDPFSFKSGSTLVRIRNHPNHGHSVARVSPATGKASRVVFSPAYEPISVPVSVEFPNGIKVNKNTFTGITTDGSTVAAKDGGTTGIVAGQFLKHPVTGEQKRVVSVSANNFTLASAFTLQQISPSMSVDFTNYVVPSGSNLAGIDAELIYDYRGFDVIFSEMDSYIIDISRPGGGDPISPTPTVTASENFGGNLVLATENKRYEEMMLLTTPLEMPQTQMTWTVKTITGSAPNDSATSSNVIQEPRTLVPNERVIFDNSMVINSYINESQPGTSDVVYGTVGEEKSILVRAILSSSNPNLSPVLDASRLTTMLVSNRLDNPRGILAEANNQSEVINTIFDDKTIINSTTPSANAGLIWFSTSSPEATGQINNVFGSKAISGTNTKFTSEIRVGDIVTTSNAESIRVAQVVSDTELILERAPLIVINSNDKLYINAQNMKIKTANSAIAARMSNLEIGKYVTISGAATQPTGSRNVSDVLLLDVEYTPNSIIDDSDLLAPKRIELTFDYRTLAAAGFEANNITLVQKDNYIDEIAPNGGSCASKYVCKKLVVTRPSNALKVLFDASRHESCQLELYYRLDVVNSPRPFDEVPWTKAAFNTTVNGITTNFTPAANISNVNYTEYGSTISDLPAFIGAQVKIVMRGGNPARSIRIRNFRLIVLDE